MIEAKFWPRLRPSVLRQTMTQTWAISCCWFLVVRSQKIAPRTYKGQACLDSTPPPFRQMSQTQRHRRIVPPLRTGVGSWVPIRAIGTRDSRRRREKTTADGQRRVRNYPLLVSSSNCVWWRKFRSATSVHSRLQYFPLTSAVSFDFLAPALMAHAVYMAEPRSNFVGSA
jgi:hypothetical protein